MLLPEGVQLWVKLTEPALQLMLTPGQLSAATTLKLTAAVHAPASVFLLIGEAGQLVIVGGMLSCTVTVAVQVFCKPTASLTRSVTVRAPASTQVNVRVSANVTPSLLILYSTIAQL